ncbi:hypothetical protein ES703_24425 [subsurface metagenome]
MITENVDIFKGLINAIDPSSSMYPEGAAYNSDNSRIDKEGVWNKGPSLVALTGSPTAKDVPTKSGTHVDCLSILGVKVICRKLANADTIAEGGNGYAYFEASGVPKWWDGVAAVENTNYGTVGQARPSQTVYPTVAVSGIGARHEEGIYYYFCIIYNPTRDIESLPTPVIEHYVSKRYVNDVRQADVPNLDIADAQVPTGARVRWYRSKVIKIDKGDTDQLGSASSPTEFYFIGEVSESGGGVAAFADYAHDRELSPERLYTGRGAVPPQTSVDVIASFQNRTFYFVGNIAYWSSAARPEECPQSYTLKIRHDYTNGVWATGDFNDQLTKGTASYTNLTQRPLLDTGLYAEAKMLISELEDQTVVRAKQIGDKLWVWTARMTGYITATANYEGFRFVKVNDGMGLCSPWTLAVTPYGIFGADKKGIWVIEKDYPKRLDVIDIDDNTKSTYCNPSYHAASFGFWVDELKEYCWSIQKSGTPTYTQIVYQADKRAFVGPYNLTIVGGTAYTLGSVSECYLWTGSAAKDISISTRTGVQVLKFWLGQKTFANVKDKVSIEIIYNGITADKSVTAACYQNNIASETGAASTTGWSHTDTNLIGYMEPRHSGRFFELSLSIPSDCEAPIAAVNYSTNLIIRRERAKR